MWKKIIQGSNETATDTINERHCYDIENFNHFKSTCTSEGDHKICCIHQTEFKHIQPNIINIIIETFVAINKNCNNTCNKYAIIKYSNLLLNHHKSDIDTNSYTSNKYHSFKTNVTYNNQVVNGEYFNVIANGIFDCILFCCNDSLHMNGTSYNLNKNSYRVIKETILGLIIETITTILKMPISVYGTLDHFQSPNRNYKKQMFLCNEKSLTLLFGCVIIMNKVTYININVHRINCISSSNLILNKCVYKSTNELKPKPAHTQINSPNVSLKQPLSCNILTIIIIIANENNICKTFFGVHILSAKFINKLLNKRNTDGGIIQYDHNSNQCLYVIICDSNQLKLLVYEPIFNISSIDMYVQSMIICV